MSHEIHAAAGNGDLAAVSACLAKGIDVNEKSEVRISFTPSPFASEITFAFILTLSLFQIRTLFIFHNPIGLVDQLNGNTALHMACMGDHEDLSLELIARGADLEARNNVSLTTSYLYIPHSFSFL